ncbi:MAG: 23S rRNA (adenine(2503)-C(2))-methyltransferase RlmN [Bacteroidales bacterium]|nr:23S rRNA (adenine(2503)-C(2))-methyltransferase RlmN [Bacteroidales bacterium]
MNKPIIRNYSLIDLQQWLAQYNQPPFRAKQLFHWFWKKNIQSLTEITNLPKSALNQITEQITWDIINVSTIQQSSDGTIKAAFQLYDDCFVEGVIIPSSERNTACISTQVGCPVRCKFCATGNMGFLRNLNVGEIVDQVVWLNKISLTYFQKTLTNIVVMGMGEPFLNYDFTIRALKNITSSEGMNWSKQRITLSTVGIPDKIIQFADDNVGVQLAISLHAPFQEKREQLIPLAKKYLLNDVLNSLKHYVTKTNQEVTFEYLMLKEFNDTLTDAKELLRITSHLKSKINLIPYNAVDALPYQPSSEEKILAFYEFLRKRHVNVRIRKSRGQDIAAACGQLANKLFKK